MIMPLDQGVFSEPAVCMYMPLCPCMMQYTIKPIHRISTPRPNSNPLALHILSRKILRFPIALEIPTQQFPLEKDK